MEDSTQTPPPQMPGRPEARWRRLAGGAAEAARLGARMIVGTLTLAWRLVRPPLLWTLQVVLALLILLEEWGWQPLADLLGRLLSWRPLARLEAAIAALPPYPALAVFVVPSLLLLPLKFLALFLIAKGQLVLAGLLFAGAKVGATALVARLFMLTRPALMQIGWFAWAYNKFIPWKEALEAYVRASYVWRVGRLWKARVKRIIAAQWQRLRPVLIRLREAARLALAQVMLRARQSWRRIRDRWAASGR